MRALALTLTGLLAAAPAWAYLDPNAGGWLFQLLFPLLVAIGGAWAAFRTRLSMWWARLRGRRDTPAPDRDAPDA